MTRDLNEAHVRFLNAELVDVTSQWVTWPEYLTFSKNLILFSKLVDEAALDQKTRIERDRYWDLRRALRGTPLHPRECFDIAAIVDGFELDGELGVALSKLRESAKLLYATNNPMRIEMVQHFSELTKAGGSQNQKAYLLVDYKLVSKTNEILSAESLNSLKVQATKLNHAKKLEAAEIMFIFGAPEHHANNFKR